MNIAIHGEKELLIRLRDDLINNGLKDNPDWNDIYWNTYSSNKKNFILLDDDGIEFHNHTFAYDVHSITPSNYNEILNIIIERKDEGTTI